MSMSNMSMSESALLFFAAMGIMFFILAVMSFVAEAYDRWQWKRACKNYDSPKKSKPMVSASYIEKTSSDDDSWWGV